MIGQAWNNLDDTQKQPYNDTYAKDKLRYAQELASYEKNGFFINQKGENSKDLFKPVFGEDIVQPKKPFQAFLFFSIDS